MRIERQGTIETQPVYSHVGYTAAAMIANMAGPVLGLCALTPIALSVGLMVARRTRRVWGVGAALAMLAPAAVWCGVGYEKGRAGLEALGVHTALYVLEQTCEDIDARATETGSAASEDEAKGRFLGGSGLRGGRRLEYVLLDEPGPDGQIYEVTSHQLPGADSDWRRGPEVAIRSSWLGADGVRGTADDAPELVELLLPYRRDSPGREPRAD